MIFKKINEEELKNKELADTVKRLQKLTDGGYDLYDKNDAAITRYLKRALRLAKEEKEWYLYFDGLFNILYQFNRSGNYRQIVKYAEIYYKDSELYMDRELPNYPGTDMAPLNTWTYDMIYDAYEEYCQIDDAKMKAFMKKYEETGRKYGKAYCCYEDEMSLAVLYRDKKMAEHGRIFFEKYENEVRSCYVCAHKIYLGYYLLNDRREKAEEMMLDLINRNIPKQHQWCYEYCENAQAENMYCYMLHLCLTLGKTEYFRYFYEKYWKKQPREKWRTNSDSGWVTMSIYLCAVSGNFDELEGDLRMAAKDMEEKEKYSTVVNMRDGLEWYCYFTLLERSGVKEVEIELPGMEEKENGRVSCKTLQDYMERFADDHGKKFSEARAAFDYESVKKAYLECAGV